MRTPLLIYGAGGLGREVLSLVRLFDDFEVSGFLDDGLPKNTMVKGIPVIGGFQFLGSLDEPVSVILAIGDPLIKKDIADRLSGYRIQFPVIKHPSVILQEETSIRIGEGTILCAGSIFTTDIVIGKHVLINLGCTIGHDAMIGNHSSLMPGVNVSGEAVIGDSVLIGSGTNVLNGVKVGDRSIVGMGAVVIRDVGTDITVAGVPAKRISA